MANVKCKAKNKPIDMSMCVCMRACVWAWLKEFVCQSARGMFYTRIRYSTICRSVIKVIAVESLQLIAIV